MRDEVESLAGGDPGGQGASATVGGGRVRASARLITPVEAMVIAALEAAREGRLEETCGLCVRALTTEPAAAAPHGLAALLESATGHAEGPRLLDAGPPRSVSERRESLESLVAALVEAVARATADELDRAVDDALARLGHFVAADRAYVFAADPSDDTISNTHEWVAEGISAQIDGLQRLPMSAFSWTFESFRGGAIDIAEVDKMPDEAAVERALLQAQGIRSILVVPFTAGGEHGFVGFDAVRRHRPWTDEDVTLLKVASAVLGVAIERRRVGTRLTSRESRIAAVLAALPDLVLAIDVSGRILMAKDHEDLAAPLEAVRGRSLADILPEDLVRAALEAVRGAAADGRLRTVRYALPIRGQEQHFEARFARQDASSVIVVIRNVTEQVAATRELEEHRALLRRLASRQLLLEEDLRSDTARRIHDGIGQDLAMARLLVKRARAEVTGPASESLIEATRVLDGSIAKARELTLSLSPPALQELGLMAAVEMAGRALATHGGLRFEFEECTSTERLPRALEIVLFRVARELMTNVVEHASASCLTVFCECHDERVAITVTDDGIGPPREADVEAGGFGLVSAREQLATYGGTLSFGRGTPRGSVAIATIASPFAGNGVLP